MKRLLFLIIILFISISAVSAADNLTDAADDADSFLNTGVDILPENDSEGDSNPIEPILTEDEGNSSGNISDDNSTVDVGSNVSDDNSSEVQLSIQGKNLVWYVKANPVYKFKIVDSNGNGVAVKNVKVTLNGKSHYVNTDENGVGKLPVNNLKAGKKYTISVRYENLTLKSKIKLFSSRI